MATSIHHGPPGSFKSFTLVQRFAIDALKQGRIVITNIRGFTSIDRIQDQFPNDKFPDSADLLFVNTEVEEGRRYMAGWFHWVPLRSLIIIDEGQRIYPDRRDFRLESLDIKIIPPGFHVDEINIEVNDEYTGQRYIVRRPEDVFTAFDMQRHFQWDLFISTPNIAKIKTPIREVAETAYRHKSLSGKLPLTLAKLCGLHNAWYEFQHDPENAGKLASQIIGKPRKYKADERIFKCYQSTATGEHTPSKADQSIFGDPKLKFLAFVLVLAFGVSFYTLLNYSKPFQKPLSSTSSSIPSGLPNNKKNSNSNSSLDRENNRTSVVSFPGDVSVESSTNIFDQLGYRLLQVSYQLVSDQNHHRLAFLADSQDGIKYVTYQELFISGFRLVVHGLCNLSLIAPDRSILKLGCSSSIIRSCSVFAMAPGLAVRRDCHKYGDHEPETIPASSNSLVASASTVFKQ